MSEDKRLTKDGKYALIKYFIKDCGLDMQQVIDLKPREAVEMLPPDNKELMDDLKKYVSKNMKNIQTYNIFFPGKNGKSSEKALLYSLHFYLKSIGLTLADLGLKTRPVIKEEKLEPKDIHAWALDIFKK